MPSCLRLLVVLATLLTSTIALAGQDVWIFSGQSNMKKIGGTAREAVGKVIENHGQEYESIYVAEPGKPIEGWLDPEHRDYEKLGMRLDVAITAAKREGAEFRGFVWYQGESDVDAEAGRYERQLAELVRHVRERTGVADLPVIVVQIGAATSYEGRDWAVGVVREAQRQFVERDGHAALVTAIDAPLGDYTVHLSDEGSRVVADRVAAAADRLAYGNEKAHWGPQLDSARFVDESRRLVHVSYRNVDESLKLGDGWLAGFGASRRTRLPVELSDLEDALSLGELAEDFVYPETGVQQGDRSVLLKFRDPLPADARLSHAPMRNAQYGPHRRWGLAFGGLTDGSGHHAPAFTLVPVSEPIGRVDVPSKWPAAAELHDDWTRIAVNCVGRFPESVTAPDAVAGVKAWRQPFWNPVSSGTLPNLVDETGLVTPIGFHSGVWYMTPYFRELDDGDDALMASWCKNGTHGFQGLKPGAEYDLAIYLLQGPPKQGEAPPRHRSVRISVLDVPPGKNRKHATTVVERTVDVPASGTFDGFQIVPDDGPPRGNVLVLENVSADARGRIEFDVEAAERKGDRVKWADTTLAGVQIRPAAGRSRVTSPP